MLLSLILALALSVDTFVLAITIGLCMKEAHDFKPYKYSLIFAIAQAGLFALGDGFSVLVPNDFLFGGVKLHLSSIVFAVLAVKMLIEFFKEEELFCPNLNDIGKIAVLTSIDALIVGITPLKFEVSHLSLITAIFIATTIAAYLGIELARKLKYVDIIEKYALIIGSILLLFLAIKSF